MMGYLDIAALCIVVAVISASYALYGDDYEYEMFVFLAAGSIVPWIGCMCVGGSPARWFPVLTNTGVVCGMAAYGVLLSFLVVVALFMVHDIGMLLVAGAAMFAVFRVSAPMAACAIHRAFRLPGSLPV